MRGLAARLWVNVRVPPLSIDDVSPEITFYESAIAFANSSETEAKKI